MPAVEASPRNQLNLLNQVIRPVLQAVFLFAARHDKAVSSAALKGVLVRPQPRSASRSFRCIGGSDAACARLDPKEWHRLENGVLSRRHGREKLEIARLRRLHARLNTRERASLKEAARARIAMRRTCGTTFTTMEMTMAGRPVTDITARGLWLQEGRVEGL
jgi:hypothetical protein